MSPSGYVHGAPDDAEVSRLVRQAAFVAGFSLASFEAPPGARVLDVGTGVGAMAAQLARLFPGIRLTGLDVSEAQLERARALHPTATYVCADAAALPFADESFERVHMSWVLEHVADPVAILREIRRVLTPDGVAHLSFKTTDGRIRPVAPFLEAAIPLWRRAGMLAVDRVALREASANLQKGLALVAQLPASPERDRLELSIREPLNAAWTGLSGWAAAEVGDNAQEILRLTSALGRTESRMLAMWWMWTTTITQGRIADSREWATRMLEEGEQTADVDLQLFGHAAMMVQRLLQGDLAASCAERDLVLARYDPQRAERWIQLTGHDLRTFVEVYGCQLTWMMGYPDRARRESAASVEHARTVGHAFNLVWAITFSAYAHAYGRDEDRLRAHLDEADRLAAEQALAFISVVSIPQARGVAEILAGRPREAIQLLRQGIEGWTRRGGHVRVPYLGAALAEATALDGDLEAALAQIDESLAQIARPGWQEREWLAEALRVKGWILGRAGRTDEAEAILWDSIRWAREQSGKSWELRSAITLARLLAEREERARALELLAPIHAWFTEGFDTHDLREASALLAELRTA